MPSADAWAKQNHFFGIFARGGICSWKVALSIILKAPVSILQALFRISGRLSVQTVKALSRLILP